MASVFAKLNFVEKFNKLGPTKTSDEIKEVKHFYRIFKKIFFEFMSK